MGDRDRDRDDGSIFGLQLSLRLAEDQYKVLNDKLDKIQVAIDKFQTTVDGMLDDRAKMVEVTAALKAHADILQKAQDQAQPKP